MEKKEAITSVASTITRLVWERVFQGNESSYPEKKKIAAYRELFALTVPRHKQERAKGRMKETSKEGNKQNSEC